MKILVTTSIFFFLSGNCLAETMMVSFDPRMAQQAESATDLRQEQQALPEDENIYDEFVYDLEPSTGDDPATHEQESYTN